LCRYPHQFLFLVEVQVHVVAAPAAQLRRKNFTLHYTDSAREDDSEVVACCNSSTSSLEKKHALGSDCDKQPDSL
jgi:hypothetical protein